MYVDVTSINVAAVCVEVCRTVGLPLLPVEGCGGDELGWGCGLAWNVIRSGSTSFEALQSARGGTMTKPYTSGPGCTLGGDFNLWRWHATQQRADHDRW